MGGVVSGEKHCPPVFIGSRIQPQFGFTTSAGRPCLTHLQFWVPTRDAACNPDAVGGAVHKYRLVCQPLAQR